MLASGQLLRRHAGESTQQLPTRGVELAWCLPDDGELRGQVRTHLDLRPVDRDDRTGSSAIDRRGPVDAVGRPLAGRRGREHPGVGRERRLDDGCGEGLAHCLGIHVADGEAQQGLRVGSRRGILERRWGPVDIEFAHRQIRAVRARGSRQARLECLGEREARDGAQCKIGLGLGVESGHDERHGVAEAAEVVGRHLQALRRRLSAHAADAHAVGTLLGERDRVEAGGGVGVGVGRRTDLVEQLRRDGAHRDRTAAAQMLGDDA